MLFPSQKVSLRMGKVSENMFSTGTQTTTMHTTVMMLGGWWPWTLSCLAPGRICKKKKKLREGQKLYFFYKAHKNHGPFLHRVAPWGQIPLLLALEKTLPA